MRTKAPILSSLRRIVPQLALASWCWLEADATQGAEQHIGHRGEPQAELVGPHGGGRGAVGEEVELAFLDAVLHLAAGAVEVLVEVRAIGRRRSSEVTTKRGLASPWVHSALATTRRRRLQLSRVVHMKSLKRRADLPVCWLCLGLLRRSSASISLDQAYCCAPGRTGNRRGCSRTRPSTPRGQSPIGAQQDRTSGQRCRICATMRSTSSNAPAELHRYWQAAAWPPTGDRPQNT